MIDAVLSYHMDPQSCGVAKFNAQLAQRLGVPMLPLEKHSNVTPLISVKFSEMPREMVDLILWYRVFDLFVHDTAARHGLRPHARRYYDARDIGCPSTIDGNATRGAYRVLTFGMAHKILVPHFARLKDQLDAEHPDYTVEVSSSRHCGQSDGSEHLDALRAIFGSKLRVLGYLADDALAKELREVDAVALYYDPAVRANNTTVWAAVDAGKTLYTNTDAHSPVLTAGTVTWDRVLEAIRG